MTYQTVEAHIKGEKIIFGNNFVKPKKTIKVLVTFIENEELEYPLHELNKNELTNEIIKDFNEAKKLNSSDFINI